MNRQCAGGAGRNRWRRIAAELRRDILSGAYRPGDRLPSSTELRRRFGVSGQTVQNAVNALRAEGLLVTRPGLGWFIRRPPQIVRLVRRGEPRRDPAGRLGPPPSYYGSEAIDWLPEVATEVRFERATAGVAADLRIQVGAEILIRARTWTEDGEVVALATSYFARSLSRGTAIESADTGPGGVLACLLAMGHHVTRHVERVTVCTPDDEEAGRFARQDRPALIRVERATMSPRRVLGVIHIVALADRFELCYELPMDRVTH